MSIRSRLRLIKNLILVALSICSTSYICYAENSAQDLGGVSNNKIRQINTMKADHNLQLRQIRSSINDSFGEVGQSLDQPKRLEVPQLSVLGKDGGLSASDVVNSTVKPVDESVKSDETFDGYVNQLYKNYKYNYESTALPKEQKQRIKNFDKRLIEQERQDRILKMKKDKNMHIIKKVYGTRLYMENEKNKMERS